MMARFPLPGFRGRSAKRSARREKSMALLGRLAGLFGLELRSRGREYQRGGAVHITRHSDTSVRASVQGTRSYRVDITWDDGQFEYQCNCPYAAEHDAPCKHVWATL